MAKLELTLDNLGLLDRGTVGKMIDRALAAAIQDFEDRHRDDGKVRRVEIAIEIGTSKGRQYVDVQACAKLPKYRSNATEIDLLANADGEVVATFQEMSPENASQPNFPQLDPETKRRAE